MEENDMNLKLELKKFLFKKTDLVKLFRKSLSKSPFFYLYEDEGFFLDYNLEFYIDEMNDMLHVDFLKDKSTLYTMSFTRDEILENLINNENLMSHLLKFIDTIDLKRRFIFYMQNHEYEGILLYDVNGKIHEVDLFVRAGYIFFTYDDVTFLSVPSLPLDRKGLYKLNDYIYGALQAQLAGVY